MTDMATHYRGQRIKDLLQEIEVVRAMLDDNTLSTRPEEDVLIAEAYTKLAIAKAKLTALQGEPNHDQKGKKPRRSR